MNLDDKAKKESNTPAGLVIWVQDLVAKQLKDCGIRQAILDAVVKEQFVEELLDDVKVWEK